MKVIGLTGGIACGKSTVSNRMLKHGWSVIDLDVVSRVVVLPGKPGLEAIIREFGQEFANADGTLNRAKLGGLVFYDRNELKKLSDIMLPLVYEEVTTRLEALRDLGVQFCVLDDAMLFESGLSKLCQLVIAVDCDQKQQIQRLMARNNLSGLDAQNRVDSQMERGTRLTLADLVIDNTKTVDHLENEITRVIMDVTNAENPVQGHD